MIGYLSGVITSFTINIVTNLVWENKLKRQEKKIVEDIKSKISEFNGRYDSTDLDTYAFQKYFNSSEVQNVIYARIFTSYIVKNESIDDFKINMATNAVQEINKYYTKMGRNDIRNEDIFFEYFNELVEVLIAIRNKLLSSDASAQTSILVDEIRGSKVELEEVIIRQFEDDKINQVIAGITDKIFVGEPPPLDSNYLRRVNVAKQITDLALIAPIEVIGVTGSGKTLFAREVIEYVKSMDNNAETLYIGLRDSSDLRDMLLAIIINLKKLNCTEQGEIVSQLNSEQFIKNAAEKISSNEKNAYIVLDFVDGTCNDHFAKEFIEFLEIVNFEHIKIIALGQQSIFRGLSGFRREVLKIPEPIYMPGFNFEQFLELVYLYHNDNYDSVSMWSIFEKLTAGRSSGLIARLAKILASSPIDEMKRLAEFPSDKIMEESDRQKYSIVRKSFPTTSEKIICFLLPFSINEANTIFPSDHISETVREMLLYGLLHHHDELHFELHETTRAGLEEMVPPATRKSIHEVLANHYLTKGDIITGIIHLERAGQVEEASRISREYFLRGEYWNSLYAYIFKYKLVSESELVSLMEVDPLCDSAYRIPSFFQRMGNEKTAQALLELIVKQSERFTKDFRWAWLITESILACDANKINELIYFGIQKTIQNQPEVLEYVITGARRCRIIVNKELLEVFESQNDEIKILLIPLLLRDKRRDVFCKVLNFLNSYIPTNGSRQIHKINMILSELKLNDEQEIVEFIASIPRIEQVADIILSKSVLLTTNLSNFIWENRRMLLQECKKILCNEIHNETIIENTLRILAFLNDSYIVKVAEKYIDGKGRLSSIAVFIISLFPNLIDIDFYKDKLLNIHLELVERMSAFMILLSTNCDVDNWFKQLLRIDNSNIDMWEYLLLINSIQYPCKTVIPILKKEIEEGKKEQMNKVHVALLMKVSEFQSEEITDFLIYLLDSPISQIRFIACLCLQVKRSKRAMSALIAICRREKDEAIVQNAILAIIASQPENFDEFEDIWLLFPQITIWRVVLAGRLKIMGEANYLIRIACDPKEHWQVRRAAILAAAQLKSREVMEKISNNVFLEKLSFVQDKNSSFLGHNILSTIALDFCSIERRNYKSEKDKSHGFLAEWFNSVKNEAMFSYGTPSGEEAAKWFFEKLEMNGWPENLSGVDSVLNDLNIPILYAAVLRGLRLCGDLDAIEKVIAEAGNEWLIMRALSEWLKERNISDMEIQKIIEIIDSNPLGSSASVQNIIKNFSGIKITSMQKRVKGTNDEKLEFTKVAYEGIKQALNNGDLEIKFPLVIIDIKREQFSELVKELSPDNDFKQCWVSVEPRMKATDSGFSVNGIKQESVERYAKIREAIRPALVIANCFNEQIVWHQRLLEENKYHQNEYVRSLLAVIAVKKDSARLYDELEMFGDIYLEHFKDYSKYKLVEDLFDERVIPFLNRWANVGNDEILEVICRIALRLNGSIIDNILATLFYSWCKLLKTSYKNQHSENIHLWRAFKCLKDNPRFTQILDYDLRLSELLSLNIKWYNKNEIVEVLCKSPKMYYKIETLLIHKVSFEHFFIDEVDKLDEAAQQLFMLTDDKLGNELYK